MLDEDTPPGGTEGAPARPDDSACDHRVAERSGWPWLPKHDGGPLLAHPYCPECGLIKSLGGERPLDLGAIVNLLSGLEHLLQHDHKKITEAQKRLILKTVQAEGLHDTFGRTRAAQVERLARIVATYSGVKPDVVRNLLHHC